MPDEITPLTQDLPGGEHNDGTEIREAKTKADVEVPGVGEGSAQIRRTQIPPHAAQDTWRKLESAAKIIGGLSIPILGLVVTFTLGTQSENRRATEFQTSMLTEREKADSEIREKMFDFLLTRYFSAEQKASTRSVEDFQTRLMVLRLLLENFQEHFSSKSLFTHLYSQIKEAEAKRGKDAERWRGLKMELIDVGRNTTSEQLVSLAPVSLMARDIWVPLSKDINPNSRDQSKGPIATSSLRIPLYRRAGLRGGEFEFERQSQGLGFPRKEGDGSGVLSQTRDQLTEVPASDEVKVSEEAPHFKAMVGLLSQIGRVFLLGENGDSRTVRYSIILRVKDIREDAATILVAIYEDKYVKNELDADRSSSGLTDFKFDASYFSTPYVDNTLLPDGSRFAVIYRGCMDDEEKDLTCQFPIKPNHQPKAGFDVVTFKAGFVSRRDRPDIDQLLKETTKSNSWWNLPQRKP
jgi:hypothetical protein